MINKLLKISNSIFGYKFNHSIVKCCARLSRKLAHKAHKVQFDFEWGNGTNPEWFDHYCDQFYYFRKNQTPLWVERGTFNLLAINQGADVLELCCGDGFNAYHFYSIRAKSIISVDFDKTAIAHAKKFNTPPNGEFRLCDIRTDMPEGKFNNILWDAAIEHFTETEIDQIMTQIKSRLKVGGIVSGYTIVELPNGNKSIEQHEYEFKSKEDLRRFFEPHFKNVKVFETIYPSRHNLYFWASDDILPFDENWEMQTSFKN